MQNRVLPDALARSAAWYTSSTSSSGSRLEPRPLAPGAALGAVAAVLRAAARLDAQQRAPLDLRGGSSSAGDHIILDMLVVKSKGSNHSTGAWLVCPTSRRPQPAHG